MPGSPSAPDTSFGLAACGGLLCIVVSLPSGAFSMLLLFHSRVRVHRPGATALFEPIVAHWLALGCTGAVAYSFDRRAAHRLLDANTLVRALSDRPVDISTLDARALEPMLVGHPPENARQSCLEASRRAVGRRRGDPARFLRLAYRRRRWLKAVPVRIS